MNDRVILFITWWPVVHSHGMCTMQLSNQRLTFEWFLLCPPAT